MISCILVCINNVPLAGDDINDDFCILHAILAYGEKGALRHLDIRYVLARFLQFYPLRFCLFMDESLEHRKEEFVICLPDIWLGKVT